MEDLRDVMLKAPMRELAEVNSNDSLHMVHENMLDLVEQNLCWRCPFFDNGLDIVVGDGKRIVVREFASDSTVPQSQHTIIIQIEMKLYTYSKARSITSEM